MTPDDIQTLPAGPALNALVAEWVMGQQVIWDFPEGLSRPGYAQLYLGGDTRATPTPTPTTPRVRRRCWCCVACANSAGTTRTTP